LYGSIFFINVFIITCVIYFSDIRLELEVVF